MITILPPAAVGSSVFTLVSDTGMFAKFILLVLFIISVISWAIIWDRARLYLNLRKKGRLLKEAVSKDGLISAINNPSPFLPSLEGSILLESKRAIESKRTLRGTSSGEGGSVAMIIRSILDRRAVHEISEMEKYLIFLSTTASVSPFLGLLGTVWGIMSSFLSMGAQGTASIEVVGPGIAEALATTIAGLGAAIPALVGYNLLVRHVHRQESRLDLFISRVIEEVEIVDSEPSVNPPRPSYEEKPV
jgi:biopolymer transport protein TolQ